MTPTLDELLALADDWNGLPDKESEREPMQMIEQAFAALPALVGALKEAREALGGLIDGPCDCGGVDGCITCAAVAALAHLDSLSGDTRTNSSHDE